jgi:hypothetical protein
MKAVAETPWKPPPVPMVPARWSHERSMPPVASSALIAVKPVALASLQNEAE